MKVIAENISEWFSKACENLSSMARPILSFLSRPDPTFPDYYARARKLRKILDENGLVPFGRTDLGGGVEIIETVSRESVKSD